MLRVLKWVGLSIGGLILAVVLFFGAVILRKSVPYFFPGDVEQLAASGPYNSERMATELCGTKADYVGAHDRDPETALPKATLVSWWPLIYPAEGTATVRIKGAGLIRAPRTITGTCEGTMTFRYRLAWVDNGRAVVLEKQFLNEPKVTR
jgi:hypothetical protein